MDATEEFLREKKYAVPDNFVVTGGSKVNPFDDEKFD
jgi:hypothetical protein